MKIKLNQLKSGVVLSYINVVLNSVVHLLYTPILIRTLGSSEYGVYSFSLSLMGYLSLLNFGFGTAYVRYYSQIKAKNDRQGIKVLNGMFIILFCAFGLLVVMAGVIIHIFSGQVIGSKFTPQELGLARRLIWIMVLNMAVSMPSSVFTAMATAHERYVFQRGSEVIRTICGPIVTIPLLLIGYRSVAVANVTLAMTVIHFLLNIWYCRHNLKVEFSFRNFDTSLFKSMSVFSSFVLLQKLMDQFNWQLDKLILAQLCGSLSIAVYTVGGQFNYYFMNFSVAISTVFIPRLHRMVAEKYDPKAVTELFIRIGRLQFMVMALLFSGFVFFGKPFIYMWAGEGYENSYFITILLAAPVLIAYTQDIGYEILRALGKHGFINMIHLGICICNVFISIPLARAYGEVGAALGTGITMLVGQLLIQNLYYWYVAKIDVKLFFKELGKFIPALITPVVLGIGMVALANLYNIFVMLGCIAVYSIAYGISIWFLGCNDSEKDTIKSTLVGLRKRLGGGSAT